MHEIAIYGVYDNKAKSFVGRFLHTHKHEATALRDFTEAVTSDTPIRRHPDDFELVRLGYLDEEGKQLTPDTYTVTTARKVLDVIEANAANREAGK